jgi:peptidoglycan/LPS O-acetylase OafA/YrhL
VSRGVPAADVINATGALEHVLTAGRFGVELFFIISGFVLGLPFAVQHLRRGSPVRLGSYFLRRLTRLEPPYVVSMLGFFALLVVLGHESARSLFPHLLASLSYLHNQIYGVPSTVNTVAWSLEVVVQFYILAPVLGIVFLVPRRALRRALIIAVGALAIGLQLRYIEVDTRPALSLLYQIQFFLTGFLLADIYVTDWEQKPQVAPGWDLVSLIGWPLLVWTLLHPAYRAWLFPPIALVLFLAVFRGRLTRRIMGTPWLVVVGGMCYSIYLLHYPLIAAIGRIAYRVGRGLPYPAAFLTQMTLVLPPLLLVSTAYFVLIERPCMDREWPQKLLRAWRRLGTARDAEASQAREAELPTPP